MSKFTAGFLAPALTIFLVTAVLTGPSFASSAQSENKDLAKATAQAKEEAASQTGPKVEITVTAPRVEIPLKKNPAATTVVETAILRTMPRTIAIDEVLKLVPGVKVDNQADGERVHLSIRGEGILTERGTRGIKTLVDGIPLNDPSGYVSDFYDVDWIAVRRIEVLRGPAAAFYGSGSSGGIINILTRDGGPDPVSAGAGLVRGAFGLKKGFAEVGGTAGLMNYSLTGSMLSGDGYRDWSAYKGDNARGKFAFTLSPKIKVTAILGWTDFYNQNPEGPQPGLVQLQPESPPPAGQPRFRQQERVPEEQRGTGGVTTSISLSEEPGPDRDRLLPEHPVHGGRPFDGHPSRSNTPGLMTQLNSPGGLGPVHEPFERRPRLRLAGHR